MSQVNGVFPTLDGDVELDDRQRRQVDAIASLLVEPDRASIRQAVELAVALGDRSVYAALVEGVAPPPLMAEERAPHKRFPTLSRGALFERAEGQPAANPDSLALAMAHLVAASELPIRDRVRSLALGARGRPSRPMPELWIDGLERCRSLTHLDLHLSATDRGIDLRALQRFPSLTHLRLRGPFLPGPLPALAHLEVLDGVQIEFHADATFPALRSIRGRLFNETVLTRDKMPNLVDVAATGQIRLEGYQELGQLSFQRGEVELPDCRQVDHLRVASVSLHAPDLRHVGTLVGMCPGVDLNRLETLEKVQLNRAFAYRGGHFPEGATLIHPMVVLSGPELTDLGNVGQLVGLETLTLRRVQVKISLETLRHATDLRVVNIRSSPGVTDLSPLVGLPNLETIIVDDVDRLEIPDELAAKIKRVGHARRRSEPASGKA